MEGSHTSEQLAILDKLFKIYENSSLSLALKIEFLKTHQILDDQVIKACETFIKLADEYVTSEKRLTMEFSVYVQMLDEGNIVFKEYEMVNEWLAGDILDDMM